MDTYTDAQMRLIDEHRDINVDYESWSSYITDAFKELLTKFGIPVSDVYWSGFWSQGDGASFDTNGAFTIADLVDAWELRKFEAVHCSDSEGARELAWFVEPPKDYPLLKLLQDQAQHYALKYAAYLMVKETRDVIEQCEFRVNARSNHYSHSGTMFLDWEDRNTWREDDNSGLDEDVHNSLCDLLADEEKPLQDWLRELADALYRELESEHEYQTSDEQVWESIVANDMHLDLEDDDADEDESATQPAIPAAA
jgi:hypothetical protein